MKSVSILRLVSLALLCCVFGCGGGNVQTTPPADDPNLIAIKGLVQMIGDKARTSGDDFADSFVEDAAPQDSIKDYAEYMYQTQDDTVVVEGDSAKMQVEAIDPSDQGIMVEWSFKKVDGTWKIVEAPLTPPTP